VKNSLSWGFLFSVRLRYGSFENLFQQKITLEKPFPEEKSETFARMCKGLKVLTFSSRWDILSGAKRKTGEGYG